jgi:hypothetical protein
MPLDLRGSARVCMCTVQVSLKEVYPELALRLMRCTRTEERRVNKKGKRYRAALGEAGIQLATVTIEHFNH